jgi:hypothetical protein
MRGRLLLFALFAALPARAEAPARLTSTGFTTWIYAEPKRSERQLGYVRVGESVALRREAPQPGAGCPKRFHPVVPYGWVCEDRTVSFTADERYVRAMQLARPAKGLMPFGYALSNGTPMYRRLPSPEEWAREERFLGPAGSYRPQSWGNRGHELLAEVRPIPASDPVPWFFAGGGSAGQQKPLGLVRRQIPHGSMLSFTRAFEHHGRTFLLSADGTIVPADRVRPFRESQFEGVELGKGVELPIAFMRARARPKYRRLPDGSFEKSGEQWPVRSSVALAPKSEPAEHAGKRYLQTQGEHWIAEEDATVIRPREALPFGIGENEKYLITSITQGTLVAYQGLRPIFATLASPGAGGVPIKGRDPVKASTTPLGAYRITFKHRAATMSPEFGENRSFWIADVPYTQYFNAPFALHTAYWHENFGEPMSAGCVNVSPRDGRWLFEWTDPKVPDGWNGAGPGGPAGKGTFVIVTR